MSGKLTTHVLDLASGKPAAGMRVELRDEAGALLAEILTNHDGRADAPLLEGPACKAGVYTLIFHVGAYFGDAGGFLGQVPVRFRIADSSRPYHVPLLCSPWAYSTYHGS